MNKRPAFQFYPADWRKDPQLQMCDMATQGIWINLLCCMWESQEEGILSGTWNDFARLLGISVQEVKRFYIAAKRYKFADVTNSNNIVTIINRRMRSVFLERQGTKQRVQKHRQAQRNDNVTPPSSTSPSTSTSRKDKTLYLDFVFLSKEEHEKLLQKYGENNTQKLIEQLNNYIGSKGRQYKSHYYTLLSWARRDNIPLVAEKPVVVCAACGEEGHIAYDDRITGKPTCSKV